MLTNVPPVMLGTKHTRPTDSDHLHWKLIISRNQPDSGLSRCSGARFNPLHQCDPIPSVIVSFSCDLFRALPAFTIHTAVSQAQKAFANAKNTRVKMWGPTLTGLALVPILPYLYDHPIEVATERVFDWARRAYIARRKTEMPTEEK